MASLDEALSSLSNLRLPDPWQAEAVRALTEGHDVVIQAPTGAGKTYVFEQYFSQSRLNGQAIYTVPTRALANDKFAEWRARGWRAGITTGDVTHDPEAPLVVATLEAQQNPKRAALLVVDEYQWLGDTQRGNHYEGTIMSLGLETQLLLLSGSVGNPDAVADWLRKLGRDPVVIIQKERPVPLEEVDVEGLARRVPASIQGYWVRRLAGALREDLGPILVFAPHRKEAEKIAFQAAAALPCDQPLHLSHAQQQLAGKDLAKLLTARIGFHHSGLSYAQRAGLIEPLAKAGQLRIVVATLGLSAGINFSLRSVLVTSSSYTAGGIPIEVTPAELLQMFGRAGRRGLDETGYALAGASTARLGQARVQKLKRGASLPWKPLLEALARGEDKLAAAQVFQGKLFSAETIPMGIENTARIEGPLPCGLKTDTGRARLVRREVNPAPFCIPCIHREECLRLDTAPTLIWFWNRLGLLDKNLELTRRGRATAQFSGAEALGVVAALEDESYPIEEIVDDLANLMAGDRFCGMEARWSGRMAFACQKAYKRFTIEGFLTDGMPLNYGTGGAEIIRQLRQKGRVLPEDLGENAKPGDVDRLFIEWKSLVRQVSVAEKLIWPRWLELQARCQMEREKFGAGELPEFPPLTAEQKKPISHRLYW